MAWILEFRTTLAVMGKLPVSLSVFILLRPSATFAERRI